MGDVDIKSSAKRSIYSRQIELPSTNESHAVF
jgi:hypothetical protein